MFGFVHVKYWEGLGAGTRRVWCVCVLMWFTGRLTFTVSSNVWWWYMGLYVIEASQTHTHPAWWKENTFSALFDLRTVFFYPGKIKPFLHNIPSLTKVSNIFRTSIGKRAEPAYKMDQMKHCWLKERQFWELWVLKVLKVYFRRLPWVYHHSEVRGQLNNEIRALPIASLQASLQHLSNFNIINKHVSERIRAWFSVCLWVYTLVSAVSPWRVFVRDTITWSDGSVPCEEVKCQMCSGPRNVLLWETSCLNTLYKWSTWLWALFIQAAFN